jgi:hypothetical protein
VSTRFGDVRTIFILRALGLGDFLTAVPAYRGLRQGFPDATITLAAPRVLEPLAQLTGAIDRLLPVNGLGELSAMAGAHPPASAVSVDLRTTVVRRDARGGALDPAPYPGRNSGGSNGTALG